MHRCKLPLDADDEKRSGDGLAQLTREQMAIAGMHGRFTHAQEPGAMERVPGSPELNLRVYTESPEYRSRISGQIGSTRPVSCRKSAVRGVSSHQ